MPNITSNTDNIRDVLQNTNVIAVVGHSHLVDRTSYRIANYLRQQGYTVYAVNPTVQEIDGEKSYASLADVPEPIDIVNVFRGSRHLPRIVDEAISVGAKTVWAQMGITHEEADAKANEAHINLVMDRCIKVEHVHMMPA